MTQSVQIARFLPTLCCALSVLYMHPACGMEFVDRAAEFDSIVDRFGETYFTLRPEDAPIDESARAQRAEKMPPLARAGSWYHYTWDTWLPADTPLHITQDVQTMQWRNRLGAPRTSIHLDGGKWIFKVSDLDGSAAHYSFDGELVTWLDWDMFVYWSEGQDGFIRLVAGDTVLEHHGPNIWPEYTGGSDAPHWSFGLYRPQWKHGELLHSDEVALRRITFRDYSYTAFTPATQAESDVPDHGSTASDVQGTNPAPSVPHSAVRPEERMSTSRLRIGVQGTSTSGSDTVGRAVRR